MTARERVPCERCGEKTAMSSEQLARLRAELPDFPPWVANVCTRCMTADPAMKAETEAWAEANFNRLVGRLRSTLARPLEAIDRFVEGLR